VPRAVPVLFANRITRGTGRAGGTLSQNQTLYSTTVDADGLLEQRRDLANFLAIYKRDYLTTFAAFQEIIQKGCPPKICLHCCARLVACKTADQPAEIAN